MVEKEFAAYGSLSHKTSGASSPALMTCPEIQKLFLDHYSLEQAKLDEYLQYMTDGLRLFHARSHLLFCLQSRQNAAPGPWLLSTFGISEDVAWKWLRDLESRGLIRIEESKREFGREYEVHSRYVSLYLKGDLSLLQLMEKINDEVRDKLEKWFATGEEEFQRFDIEVVTCW